MRLNKCDSLNRNLKRIIGYLTGLIEKENKMSGADELARYMKAQEPIADDVLGHMMPDSYFEEILASADSKKWTPPRVTQQWRGKGKPGGS